MHLRTCARRTPHPPLCDSQAGRKGTALRAPVSRDTIWPAPMTLHPRLRLGPYEIQSALGAGGMGEVYRARDMRLQRDVAVKVLPAGIVDPERLARFEQEARAAAALNHPNILAVYDFGTHDAAPYIVTELLEGETLRALLDDGALPVRKAVEYATQVAQGIAAAHEKGIVHRDLKPENVFVTGSGRVKILDFGLAKLTEAEPVLAPGSMLATGVPATMPGMVLGTVGYMAPEQVRGAAADHRADIFAFGALLYEMLSGRRAFARETAAETMTAILREEPPELSTTDQAIPPSLDRLIRRCLEKNPAARFQSALDLAFALESLTTASGSAAVPVLTARRYPRERVPWIVAAAGLVLAAMAAGLLYLREMPDERTLRFTMPPPEGERMQVSADSTSLAVMSPNGRSVAFVTRNAQENTRLWLRALDALEARPLSGTDGARAPFWSPDGEWLGFFADGKLKKISVAGGSPATICDAPGAAVASWGAGDVILFSQAGTGIQKVPAAGGVPAAATTLGPYDQVHTRPVFLPDGRRFLYAAFERSGGTETQIATRRLYAGTVDSPDRTLVLTADSLNVQYAQGYLLFLRGSTLVAQPFDPTRLALTGEPVPVAEDIGSASAGAAFFGFFSVSEGVLTYRTTASASSVHQLTWFDRKGEQIALLGDPAAYQNIELLPDERRVVLGVMDPARRTRDIWTFETERGVRTRFTFDPAEERTAIPSPDGRQIVFNSIRSGALELYVKSSSGAGREELLLQDGRSKDPNHWSSDGRFLLYRVTGDTKTNDLWVLPLSGDRKPVAFIATPFDEPNARFSPDGQWVAYTSDESGRHEVYVRPFPDGDSKWQVSTAGGGFPRWRGDGREIYYLAADNTLMAAAVAGTPTGFEVGAPENLFSVNLPPVPGYPYAVTGDGRRFLVNAEVGAPTSVIVVVNWAAGLR